MTANKKTRVSLEEVKKMKGKTQWARLVAEERSVDKTVRPAKKSRN